MNCTGRKPSRNSAGITDLAVARTMYLLSAAAVSIDTGRSGPGSTASPGNLGLSREMQAFLEEQAG